MKSLRLKDKSKIAVIGGGPAGSFFAIHALKIAANRGLNIDITIFDRKHFTDLGPLGCNMCAGAIGNNLYKMMLSLGLELTPDIIRQEIGGYAFHSDGRSVELKVGKDAKIYTVFRGAGPRGGVTPYEGKRSFDQFLLDYAIKLGAHFLYERVYSVEMVSRPEKKFNIIYGKEKNVLSVDFVVGAFGVNTTILKKLPFRYIPPETWHTCQAEVQLGKEMVNERFQDMIHVFFTKKSGIKFIAITPKGDFLTISAIGKHIKINDLIEGVNQSDAVNLLPEGWRVICHCHPKIPVSQSHHPYSERFVIVGDASYSRYLKNGIESAFYTGAFAAEAALNKGVTEGELRKSYDKRSRRTFVIDNVAGKIIFKFQDMVMSKKPMIKSHFNVLNDELTGHEIDKSGSLSNILWDMFTGEATYINIFKRALNVKMQYKLISGALKEVFSAIFSQNTLNIKIGGFYI